MKNVLIVVFFLLSPILNGQVIKTFYKTGNTSLGSTDDVFFLQKKPYFFSFSKDEGFLLNDVYLEKKKLIRNLQNVDLETKLTIRTFGELKNVLYFFIFYSIPPVDDPVIDAKREKVELWSFDGEKLSNVPFPENIASGRNVFEWGSPKIVRTSAYLGLSFLERAVLFDGSSFTLVKLYPFSDEKRELQILQDCGVFHDMIVIQEVPSSEDYKSANRLYAYLKNQWTLISQGPLPATFLKETCKNAFSVFYRSEEDSYIGGLNQKMIFDLQKGSYNEHMVFSHKDNLIFEYQSEDASFSSLYITDDSEKGAKIISDKIFLARDVSRYLKSTSTFNNQTYFVIEENHYRLNKTIYSIWLTDGTPAGTKKVFEKNTFINKVLNHKGIPVFAKTFNDYAHALFTLKEGKEVPIMNLQKYPDQFMLGTDSYYDLDQEGNIYMITGSSSKSSFISIDLKPELKSTNNNCGN